jgi:hypothetical protein
MPLWLFADHQSGNIQKTGVKRKDRIDRHAGGWAEEPYNAADGEQALWRAVIMQAMVDATTSTCKPELVYHKIEAIKWLTENGDDFVDVCERAAMDLDLVRVRAKKAMANPGQWRTEAGLSERYEERREMRARKRIARHFERVEQFPPLSGCIIFNIHA